MYPKHLIALLYNKEAIQCLGYAPRSPQFELSLFSKKESHFSYFTPQDKHATLRKIEPQKVQERTVKALHLSYHKRQARKEEGKMLVGDF